MEENDHLRPPSPTFLAAAAVAREIPAAGQFSGQRLRCASNFPGNPPDHFREMQPPGNSPGYCRGAAYAKSWEIPRAGARRMDPPPVPGAGAFPASVSAVLPGRGAGYPDPGAVPEYSAARRPPRVSDGIEYMDPNNLDIAEASRNRRGPHERTDFPDRYPNIGGQGDR